MNVEGIEHIILRGSVNHTNQTTSKAAEIIVDTRENIKVELQGAQLYNS